MDTITTIAMSVDNPVVRTLGMLLHNTVIYSMIVLALFFVGENREDKRKKVILSFLITAVLVFGIKAAMEYERPCAGEDGCPDDYSFPSAHAAIAFTLMTAFLDKRLFPAYLVFALFVAFTRLNIGVHTFVDVAAALPLALISYYVTDVIWRKKHGK